MVTGLRSPDHEIKEGGITVATKKFTEAEKPQATGQQTQNQDQRLPPVKANINWLNPKDDENIRATASLTIGGAFAIHGIKVINGQNGEFVSMPSYKKGDAYKDIFHPVSKDAREQINNAVMEAYEQKLGEQEQSGQEQKDESGSEVPVEEVKGQVMKM